MTKLNVTEWYNLLFDEIRHECILVLLKWMEPGLNNSIFRLFPNRGQERPIISCHPRTDYMTRQLSIYHPKSDNCTTIILWKDYQTKQLINYHRFMKKQLPS